MFKNKPNDEEFDLSEMIDEYEEDSELRKKIEAMKQQAKQAPVGIDDDVEEMIETDSALVPPYSQSLTDTRELPRYTDSFNRNTFIDADEDVEATRVMNMEAETDDSDKTLVIMDNQKQRVFDAESNDVSDDEDDSIYLYDNKEVDEEEITEEDIEEFLGEEEKTKKAKKSIDPNKMNKMITYVITGIVAVCLVVGVGFGVKMIIDNFNTEETAKPTDKKDDSSDTTKKPDTKKPVEEVPDQTNGNNGTENGGTPSVDNSKRIAEINGMIKGYNAQIDQLQSYITSVEADIAAAQEVLKNIDTAPSNYDATIADLTEKCNVATSSISVADKTLENAKQEAEKNPEDPEKQKAYEDAKTAYDESNKSKSEYCDGLQAAIETRNQEKATAKTEAESKKTEAENKKTDYLNQIQDLQNKIQELQNERDTLQ